MEIIILLALIFLNSLFVMSEIALVSARKSKLETMAEKGDVKAKKALNLSNNPEIFLAAAQIGITFIAIVTGVYSGERFSHYISPWFEKIDFLKPYAQTIATTIIVIVVTFLSIIFGELIPKRIGLLRSESGTIDETEQHIIERVFHLGDRNITSLMTHRSDIIWFELDDTEDKIKQKIIQEPHSVYPICEGEIDNIKGVVSIKDLYVSADSTLFKELMKPALFVPENNSAYQVLEKFRESREHCCFIVDEYGSVLGLISLNDILEAIVGDIPQPDVPDYEIIKRDDGSYLVDGQIPFYDFLTHFEKAEWMNEGEHDFDTLAGFILHELERIPKAGEKLKWKGFSIEIIDMDGHRIDKVLIKISDEIREEMEN